MFLAIEPNKKSRIYGTSDQSISFVRPICEAVWEAVGGRIRPPTSASHFGLPLRPPTSASHFGLPLWPPTSASRFGLALRPPTSASQFGLPLRPRTAASRFGLPIRPPTASQFGLSQPHTASHGLPHGLPRPPNSASYSLPKFWPKSGLGPPLPPWWHIWWTKLELRTPPPPRENLKAMTHLITEI